MTAWASWVRTEARAAADKAKPRRVSRSRSRDLARASRLERVPSEMPSRTAASRRDSPSSSQSKMAARCRSGRRASSSSRIGAQLACHGLVWWFNGSHRAQPFLSRFLAGCAGPRIECGAAGDAVEPARQLFPPRDRRRFPGQHEKCRLKGILGLVSVPQHAPADAQDHHAMPLDQSRERRLRGFIAAGDKPLEKLCIAELPGRPAMEQRVQVSRYLSRRRTGHEAILPEQ